MTEKIIYSPDEALPGKVAPVTAQGGSSPQGRATDPRLFAEILAQAEAVQDRVEVRGPHGAGGAPALTQPFFPGALRDVMQSALQGGFQGVAGLFSRPASRAPAAPRAVKPRRKTG